MQIFHHDDRDGVTASCHQVAKTAELCHVHTPCPKEIRLVHREKKAKCERIETLRQRYQAQSPETASLNAKHRKLPASEIIFDDLPQSRNHH